MKVILHFASTADGKVSTRQATPSLFTSPTDKRRLLLVRSLVDAVMVGLQTATIDRMTMGLPDPALRAARVARGQKAYPLRVLVSGSGRIPLDLPLFTKRFSPVLIYSTERMPAPIRSELSRQASLCLASGQTLDIREVLSDLEATHAVRSVVCEGGATLARTLVEADAVDEIYLTIAAKLFGGDQAPGLLGNTHRFLSASRRFVLIQFEKNRAAGECYLHYGRPRSA